MIFTLNYVIAGCLWLPIVLITFDSDQSYGAFGADPSMQPYLLSVCFDVVAWIAKDSLDSDMCKVCGIFSSTLNSAHYDSRPLITTPSTVRSISDRDDKSEPLLLNVNDSGSSVKVAATRSTHVAPDGSGKQGEGVPRKAPNLSNALRREVIEFITHGLAQAVKRTAKETSMTQSTSNSFRSLTKRSRSRAAGARPAQ